MDASTQEFLVRVVWLVIGLALGYVLGVARTSLRLSREVKAELHECHQILTQEDKDA